MCCGINYGFWFRNRSNLLGESRPIEPTSYPIRVMSNSYRIGVGLILWKYLLNITAVEGAVSFPPLNKVVEVNGEAIFNCSAPPNGPLAWILTTDGITSDEIRIATGCNVNVGLQNHYRTEQPGGPTTCNLIVFNITMEQAGVYQCTDTISFRALLAVLDSSPTITYSNTPDVMEGENVVITCSLNYSGSVEPAPTLRPHFYWTDHTGNNASNVYNAPPSNNSVLSQLTVKAGREDIMPYTCRVYMQLMPSITPRYATNIPSVDSSASSPIIPVLYTPSLPVSTSGHEVITINGVQCGISVLTCSNSTGNPAPNYRWYDSAENVILTTTNTLTLAEVGRNYKCEAYNRIRNVVHNALANDTVSESDANCGPTSAVQCCVFPRKETTSVTVKGCDNGTLCDCSQGNRSIILTCNAKTFPNASYTWIGPNGQDSNAPIFDQVTMNGVYRCMAYFNKSSSNYTGDVKFPNGTNETTIEKCYMHSSDTTDPIRNIISLLACVLGGFNLIATIAFIVYYNRKSDTANKDRQAFTFQNKMTLNARFPWLQRMLPCMNKSGGNAGCTFLWVLLFILMSIFAGIIVFPILVAMANCSGERNDAKDIGMSNVHQEDSIDLYASVKSGTDAHGHAEALYDDVGPMQPGRAVVLEESTSFDNKADGDVLYTKVNIKVNAEEGVQRYPVSLSS